MCVLNYQAGINNCTPQNHGLLNENQDARNKIPHLEVPRSLQNNTTWSLSLMENPNEKRTTPFN